MTIQKNTTRETNSKQEMHKSIRRKMKTGIPITTIMTVKTAVMDITIFKYQQFNFNTVT